MYEEDLFQNQKSYNGKTIYEWNINGKSKYQIMEMIHQMMMYSTVYKQNNNTDHQIDTFITTGFTGTLINFAPFRRNLE